MFIGDFADRTGRRPAYIICFIIYIASNIGLALQDSYAALIVLRCLQSSGISIALRCLRLVLPISAPNKSKGRLWASSWQGTSWDQLSDRL